MHALQKPDETLEDLGLRGLRILQPEKGFRFGMDAVLLADFAFIRPKEIVADFGTGSGILPLLLYGRGKGSRFEAFEIQEDVAERAQRSMRLNGLEETIRVPHLPVEESISLLGSCSVDHIITNPPYAPPGASLVNPSETRAISRHQGEDGLRNWLKTAHRLLKGKGRISVIYPAPRMLELMRLLEECHLMVKRFRLIYPRENAPANLVLVEGMKDARPLLQPMPPLIVYQADGTLTAELKRIYGENCNEEET